MIYEKLNDVKEEDLDDYLKDDAYDYFDCGKGYYQDEVQLIVSIKEDFYFVTIKAEIESSKQDRGDRLYFVERIESVYHDPITKQSAYNKINSDIFDEILELKEKISKLEKKIISVDNP